MNLRRVGLDTSRAMFALHGAGQDEKAVLRRDMRRAEMKAFLAKLPPTQVAVLATAKQMLAFLGAQVAQLDAQVGELEHRIGQQHKANPVSQLLAAGCDACNDGAGGADGAWY